MKTYELITHPSDPGVKAYGDNLTELFENTACGLRDIMVDPGTVRPIRHLNIEVEGKGIEELMVEWLSNLVFLFATQGFVPASFKILEMEKQRLLAEVCGEHYDDQVHDMRTNIKAVNYEQLSINKKEDGWSAIVVFDV